MNSVAALLAVLSCAAATFVTRAAPFVLFGGKRGIPRPVLYLGTVLPPAIMAMLVVYCLRNTPVMKFPFGLPELLASAVVIGLQLWKKNNLLSIFGGTALYMLLVQRVFG
ncbi:MAG: AzlD domain-containing protein [Oscillospiraceae bacterium]